MEQSETSTEQLKRLCHYLIPAIWHILKESDSRKHSDQVIELIEFMETLGEKTGWSSDDVIPILLDECTQHLTNTQKILLTDVIRQNCQSDEEKPSG